MKRRKGWLRLGKASNPRHMATPHSTNLNLDSLCNHGQSSVVRTGPGQPRIDQLCSPDGCLETKMPPPGIGNRPLNEMC